ncbi:MAG: phosphoribosylformylglycinamidine synthase [Chloroflexi bacterium]|jgi:phosphoribosylformylglycinamidine synthase|nr:phosphoribosylformylglycinamidine synthase [Chloroflexota bacterium]|tara:strand:- start:454 stop:714 length:261 start_codon:yes stop_codon:yes gene_type:complete
MISYIARIKVTLKELVNDPQGLAVEDGLKTLGFEEINNVRIGKYIEINLNAPNEDIAREQLNEMCKKLLSNIVIENYEFELEQTIS